MVARSERVALAVELVDVDRQIRLARLASSGARLADLRQQAQQVEERLASAAPGVEPWAAALEAVTSELAQTVLHARHAREEGQHRLATAYLERALALEQLAAALDDGAPDPSSRVPAPPDRAGSARTLAD